MYYPEASAKPRPKSWLNVSSGKESSCTRRGPQRRCFFTPRHLQSPLYSDPTPPLSAPFVRPMASAKVDNRGSFGSKRSRNEASRGDGDWICPQCGNMNFSFRTVCNRGQCGAPRPSASPSPRIGPTPIPGAFDHPAPLYYGGVGAPPLMPLGVSGGYGAPLPHTGMRYDYGPQSSASGPFGLLSPYGPPGPMGGMGYGPGPGMDRYGYGYRGSPLPMPGPWSGGALPDGSASRKRRGGPDGLSEGDWMCPKCDNVNFAFRTTCNMKKCGAPRPTPASGRGTRDYSDAPEGSWTCNKCNNLNYPFRTVCNRKGCGNEKPSTSQ